MSSGAFIAQSCFRMERSSLVRLKRSDCLRIPPSHWFGFLDPATMVLSQERIMAENLNTTNSDESDQRPAKRDECQDEEHPEKDGAEGRDQPPPNPERDPKSPWLGGG